jgi:hypothetical protein
MVKSQNLFSLFSAIKIEIAPQYGKVYKTYTAGDGKFSIKNLSADIAMLANRGSKLVDLIIYTFRNGEIARTAVQIHPTTFNYPEPRKPKDRAP